MTAVGRSILQITPYYPPHLGGMENVVANLATALAARHRVTVLTTTVGAASAPRRTHEGPVRVIRSRAVEVAHTPVAPGIMPALLCAPSDAVWHLHTAHAMLPEQVAVAALLRRQRFVVHFHLDVDRSGRWGVLLPAYKRLVFGRVLRAAAAVFVLTSAQADFVAATYGVAASRIFVTPNGIQPELFRTAARRPTGRQFRLLFVGRLSPQKNLTRLLEALPLVRTPVRVDIVGDGEQRNQLVATAARLGLANVSFLGQRGTNDLASHYADADAFVLPSDKEGMPLAALEAMAAGLPVIATRVPGNAELLGDVGLLVPPEPARLAEAIDAVAGDPDLARRLAARGSAVVSGLSWDAVARRVTDVYAEVLR